MKLFPGKKKKSKIKNSFTQSFDYNISNVPTVEMAPEIQICSVMEKTLMLSGHTDEHIHIGISSVIGTREYQQDAAGFALNSKGSVLTVLCDGMGGMEEGEKASNLCVDMLCEDFKTYTSTDYAGFLCREIHKSDLRVSNLKDEQGRLLKAGTTLLGVIIDGGKAYLASVGDSRIYILRGTEMVQATRDHNYSLILKEKVEKNLITEQEAENEPKKEALISYIGMGHVARIEVNEQPFTLQNGDCILMCSDGLYKSMDEKTIQRTVQLYSENMSEAAEMLTAVASKLAQTGQDNTTVIIMKYIE